MALGADEHQAERNEDGRQAADEKVEPEDCSKVCRRRIRGNSIALRISQRDRYEVVRKVHDHRQQQIVLLNNDIRQEQSQRHRCEEPEHGHVVDAEENAHNENDHPVVLDTSEMA